MAIAHRDVAAILQKHGYKEVKKVGEGSFGKAILVQGSDGAKLICKMVDISKASSKEQQDALKEGKLLATLKHPYVVRYRDSFSDKGWFCILMDYCEGGDLTKQIEKARRSRQPFSEDQILKWLTQAILGLKYIHDKHILHRDLKPGNFFLTNGSVQMGDFGIAKVLSSTLACARTQIGTPYYLSPEVCQEKPYSWASDIWAMGCILYEMCALKVPFDAPNISGLVQKICRGPIPSPPSNFSAFTRQLLSDMLNRNPNSRPSPEDILARPKIQEIVKEMLGEAQAGLGEGDVSPPAIAPAPTPAVTPGTYKLGDLVEYNSTAHKDWLHATIIKVDGDGRIVIDLKPNTWISREEQSVRIRPRRAPNVNAVRQRSPSVGARQCGTPMQVQRSPSVGAFEPSPRRQPVGMPQRSPSVGALERVPPSPQRAIAPNRGRSADNLPVPYKKNDAVEYYSSTHKDWLPAVVVNVDTEGRIVIDLKPNTWLGRDEQASKVRHRKKELCAPRAGVASPLRQRSSSHDAPGSRCGTPQRSPSRELSPVPVKGGTPWRNRSDTPSRGASPRGGPVANQTPRMRPPGIPRVSDSPLRRRSAVGAAGMAIAGA